MKENQLFVEELSEVEVLKVKLHNREKAIASLISELDKRPLLENELVNKLKKTITILQKENDKLANENNQLLALEKGERRELKKLLIVNNLTKKVKQLEDGIKKMKYDYDVLIQKYHSLKTSNL